MALALMTLSRANLLVLDEPTNHLDVENIEVLEDGLDEYEGTVLLVSHDRAFLREVATRVWSFDETDSPTSTARSSSGRRIEHVGRPPSERASVPGHRGVACTTLDGIEDRARKL